MAKPYLVLFLLCLISDHGEGENECGESRCGGHGHGHGPAIRFPFRLQDRHPAHCGFPGFDLSCTESGDTVLELPISVKLSVKKIDYRSQVIELYDKDHCFLRQLRGLNLSSSRFRFKEGQSIDDFGLFNCSSIKVPDEHPISCLSGPTYQVFALYNNGGGPSSNSIILSCTKVYNVLSIPYGIVSNDDKILQLKWDEPACRHCEVKGMNCRLQKNSARSETECIPRPTKKNKGATLMATGAVLGFVILVVVIFATYRVYIRDKTEKEYQERIEKFLEDYRNFKPTRYSYADIKRITNQFTHKLGEGAYGTVFRGKLSNEIHVAVKILKISNGTGEEFVNEVKTIGRIHHINVVRLVGFCADGFRRAIVYEFLPNDSLEKYISSADAKSYFLGWEKLQDIALGIAKGIEYLHHGCDQRILHFDIKPRNVLLDQHFNPKISDFGLAKLCSKDQSAVSMTAARGTMGYIAPEVFSRNFGNVSYKADVYSFGMLLLEMVGGRKTVDVMVEKTSQVYFPEWIYNLLEQKEDLRVFIESDGDAQIAKKLAIVGLWCIQWHPMDRPSMKVVVQLLDGEGDKLTMPPNPFASTNPARINASTPVRPLNQELEVIPE